MPCLIKHVRGKRVNVFTPSVQHPHLVALERSLQSFGIHCYRRVLMNDYPFAISAFQYPREPVLHRSLLHACGIDSSIASETAPTSTVAIHSTLGFFETDLYPICTQRPKPVFYRRRERCASFIGIHSPRVENDDVGAVKRKKSIVVFPKNGVCILRRNLTDFGHTQFSITQGQQARANFRPRNRLTRAHIESEAMKKLGFLSFGHWNPSPQSGTRSASDVLLQSIDLALEAERIGMDGAYFRVHHFAQQLASPFPLLSAVGAKTKRIEIGTGVIDMRYENPHYMAEDAGAADLISGSRLQLGISRGSPEQVVEGWRHFGHEPRENEDDADMGRRHAEEFFELLQGKGFAKPNPRPMFANPPGLLRLEPHSATLRDRIWWGAASNATAVWAAKLGMNLQSSTLKFDESGEPFPVQQAKQIRAYRQAWAESGHTRAPRVSVSRSIFALVNSQDRAYFGRSASDNDSIGVIDNTRAVFGRTYAAEPDELIEQLRGDEAITEADTVLIYTIPEFALAWKFPGSLKSSHFKLDVSYLALVRAGRRKSCARSPASARLSRKHSEEMDQLGEDST